MALLVLSGVLLFVGLLAGWANTTVYDSATFSERTVDLLDDPAVRREMARRLTEQLALGGNQQAVTFRPAFQLAIEAAIDTDTFKSIFRTAVRQTHEALLAGQKGGTGLNLADSVSIISSTLQLPSNLRPGENEKSSLGSSLEDVTKQLSDLHVWQLEDITGGIAAGGIIGFLVLGAGGVALAPDRRRAVLRLGWVILGAGLLLAALVPAVQWFAARSISEKSLADAVRGAIGSAMGDLVSIGLGVAAYGVVAAAAAASVYGEGARFTPKRAAAAVGRWVERRRATTGGTVLLGVLALLAALQLTQSSPTFWVRVVVLGAALWLAYFGVTELLGLIRRVVPETGPAAGRTRTRRIGLAAGALVVIVGLITTGLLLTAGGAARRANAAGKPLCNGQESLCDLPLNYVLFPGTHNAMSSALYPGWLFAEHARTVESQLEKGVRALLIDTHYGVPSSARVPGQQIPLVLTDRASELHDPKEERADPVASQRADQLAARAPKSAGASRGIYLCHQRCELGATKFGDTLTGIKSFAESHPDEVLLLIIEDHTDPVETAAAIEASGLSRRAYILRHDEPLPTLGQMIRAGKNVLVTAEVGGSGVPPWYHKAYEWFQETPYNFDKVEQFSCAPNRGPANAPLFLVNHWLNDHNPSIYAKVNSRQELGDRLRRCLTERQRMPNVIAVDFSEKGDLVKTAHDLNAQLVDEFRSVRRAGRPPTTGPTTSTTAPPAGAPPEAGPVLPPLSQPTVITTLTGGDPGLFCPTVPAVSRAVSTWALAGLVATPGTRGQTDLAFGPLAARALGASLAVAPRELVRQATPALARARGAVAALRALGLDEAAVNRLADLADTEITAADDRDPVVIQERMVGELRGLVGRDRLNAAAASFADANPEPPGLFDLGSVPDNVARASGYDCLVLT